MGQATIYRKIKRYGIPLRAAHGRVIAAATATPYQMTGSGTASWLWANGPAPEAAEQAVEHPGRRAVRSALFNRRGLAHVMQPKEAARANHPVDGTEQRIAIAAIQFAYHVRHRFAQAAHVLSLQLGKPRRGDIRRKHGIRRGRGGCFGRQMAAACFE